MALALRSAFFAALDPSVAVVSVMVANNETGVIFPVSELANAAHECGALVHVDAVQGAGRLPLDFEALNADLMSLSAHKMRGPKGVGALYLRNGQRFQPFMVGGHQERERRAGTEAVALISGFGVAARLVSQEANRVGPRIRGLRDLLWNEISQRIEGVVLNGDPDPENRLPSTLNISFDNTEGETVLIGLDLAGIAASSGSACTAGSLEPSHVLLAMKADSERARAALRFSLHRNSTEEEVQRLAHVLEDVVSTVRAAVPTTSQRELRHG